MNKGESSKEKLFLAAFKCFLNNNYDKVSLANIEKEAGVTRGVTYYYSRNKQDLFCKVMDEFILNKLNIKNKLTLIEGVSLLDFINHQIEGIQKTMEHLFELTGSNSNSYMFLIYQGSKYYPDFNKKYAQNSEFEIDVWKKVIENAIIQKEILNVDIDNTAEMFRYIHLGMAYDHSFINGLDTNHLRTIFLALYNSIKSA